MNETVKKEQTKFSRLPMEVAGLFDDPYEYCIADLVYFRSHTNGGKWTCRISHIQDYTPVKRRESIAEALERLARKNIGFTKVPYGTPRKQRNGNIVQAYQIEFDVSPFEKWWVEGLKDLFRKRNTCSESGTPSCSESGTPSVPKTGNKENSKENTSEGVTKENKESTTLNNRKVLGNQLSGSGVCPSGSIQPEGMQVGFDELWNSLPITSSNAVGNILNLDLEFKEMESFYSSSCNTSRGASATDTLPTRENVSYTPQKRKNPYSMQESFYASGSVPVSSPPISKVQREVKGDWSSTVDRRYKVKQGALK